MTPGRAAAAAQLVTKLPAELLLACLSKLVLCLHRWPMAVPPSLPHSGAGSDSQAVSAVWSLHCGAVWQTHLPARLRGLKLCAGDRGLDVRRAASAPMELGLPNHFGAGSCMAAEPTMWAVLTARCDAVCEWNHPLVGICVRMCGLQGSNLCLFGAFVSVMCPWMPDRLSLL